MARYAGANHARHRRTAPERNGHGLPRHRPHRRLTPHRTPLWHHDASPPPTLRPQAHHPRRRCYRHDWRPQRKEPRAQPAQRRDPTPQPRVHQGTSSQIPRLRLERAQCRRDGQQLRLDERLHLPRLRPRGRQAHHRQLHDGQGERAATTQRHRPRRTLLHRVHLPAAARLRLPLPLSAQSREAATTSGAT